MNNSEYIDNVESWSNLIMPIVYDDSLSFYELINKLKNVVNDVINKVNLLIQSNKELTIKYADVLIELDKLNKKLDDFLNGYEIPTDSIRWEQLNANVKEKLLQMIEQTIPQIAKFVWFGLNEEGYFVAYIPNNWSDINFSSSSEGELILSY